MPTNLYLAAVVALVIRDGKVLSLRRAAQSEAYAGLWEALGGRVEPGEELVSALAREIVEESGLSATIEPRPFDAYTADRRGVPMLVVVYRARYEAGEVVLSSEHDAFAWLTAAELGERCRFARLVQAVTLALAEPL